MRKLDTLRWWVLFAGIALLAPVFTPGTPGQYTTPG
jgi:hypothetical protein